MRKLSASLRTSEEQRERLRALGLVPRPRAEKPPAKIKKKRRPGGGKKRLLADERIAAGKEFYRRLLREDPSWANAKEASALEVKKKMSLGASWFTIKRHIVNPVLAERKAQSSRRAK